MKGSAKIEYSNSIRFNCFATVSWPLRSTTSSFNLKVLGIETQEGRKHYLSVNGSSGISNKENSSGAQSIKINGKLGQTLKLGEGELVRFWMEDNASVLQGLTVNTAKVSCHSSDDWEILEPNAEFVANHLLQQLRVVYPGQEFPFWLSQSIVIRLKIDEINPGISEYGILTSSSEIIVPSISPLNTYALTATLKLHTKLRVHPLCFPKQFSLLPSEALVFSNQHHGFIYKQHLNLPNDFPSSQISLFVKLLAQQDAITTTSEKTQENDSSSIIVRLFFIEPILEANSSLSKFLPLSNVPCIYLHTDFVDRLKIPLKSWIWCSFLPDNTLEKLPHRPTSSMRNTGDMNRQNSEQFCGFNATFLECINFIQASLSLSQQPNMNHELTGIEYGNLLVQGGHGSGKSSLVENVLNSLSGPPYFIHWEIINCAKLRGKKPENIEKELSKSLIELESKQPAVLVLDDFDILATVNKSIGEPNQQEEFLQFKTCEGLLEMLMKQKQRQSRLTIICTINSKDSLNPYWVPRSGFHFFQKIVKIPVTKNSERLEIFMACLTRYLNGSGSNGLNLTAQNTGKESQATTQTNNEENDAREASTASYEDELTKRIGLALGSIHEQNATPQFLVTVAKKWGAYLQSLDIPTFYQDHECKRNVSEGREHVPSSVAFRINYTRSNEDVNKQMKVFNEILQEEIRFSGDFDQLKNKGEQQNHSKITLNSIGGLDSVKEELRKILEWPIKFPQFFQNPPVRLPCGILFYGYPGTGKSLMGKAIQTIGNAKFIHVKGPELLSKYIGASEQAVQDVFARARDSSPCILFFDEFDSLVPRRGHDSSGVTDRVVNQFLSEMDGVDGGLGEGVYLIAATSRPDLIDPAVLRPGRLDKHIFFNLPSKNERVAILKAITSQEDTSANLQLMDESAWDKIGELTEGFTGADLNSLMFSARLALVHESLSQTCSSSGESAAAHVGSSQKEIKVGIEDIIRALRDFKPSLHGQELKKFEAIYQGFVYRNTKNVKAGTKLEEDNSFQDWRMEAGKRATLA